MVASGGGGTSNGEYSEIVIGFVGPVGVGSERFVAAAKAKISGFGYQADVVRLSALLQELSQDGRLSTPLVTTPEFDRIRTHMDAGDELRGRKPAGARGMLAAAAIAKIAAHRERHSVRNETMPLPRRAWLVSSLKHPAEVEMFRRVYRAGFFLVGLFATETQRRRALERNMLPGEAHALIERDADGGKQHGQQTRKTYELADAWVQDEAQLSRFVDLIFGDPFQTPTDDEDAMALAYVSSLRSSDLSRQVGAAVVSSTGEVLATGRNEVPAPGGGQYSAPTEDRPTARDCDVGEDSNAKERLLIERQIADAVASKVRRELASLDASLGEAAGAALRDKLDRLSEMVIEALPETGLRHITEYGRAVHAEMSALTSVGRTGASTRGATLYCTTFPCHTCAKHISAAGIARVVFVEPYPKSKARDLHADSIELVGEDLSTNPKAQRTAKVAAKRTRFEPFLGVGPRRYFDLFSLHLGAGRRVERKNDIGDAIPFQRFNATPRIPLATTTYLEEEVEAAGAVADLTIPQVDE